MGVLSGKDIYSPKWITADITDASGMVHYIPIKYTIGEYFVADIEDQLYAFKIDGTRIKTWRKSLAKSFRKIYYDTSHYLPISAADLKELSDILRKNNLPRVSGNLFTVLKLVGHREKPKEEFEPTDLKKLIEDLSGKAETNTEAVMNIKNYLTHLDTDKIVTPVKKITEFLEDDLMATDPKFMGTIIRSHMSTTEELRKVTNTAINAKGPWLKIILFVMMGGLGVFVIWFMYDSGALEDFGLEGMFGDIGVSETDQLIRKNSPLELKLKVESGELDYDELPRDIQDMIDHVELPVAVPQDEVPQQETLN